MYGALALMPAPAQAAEPPKGTIAPGGELTWQGQVYPLGANVSNAAGDQLCAPSYPDGPNDQGAVPGVHQCDVFEVTVNVPSGYWGANKGGITIDIQWESADNDFDMYVFRKPPPGEPVGAPVASSAAGDTTGEHAQLTSPEGTFLVRVNPFTVAGSGYQGTIKFFTRDPIPTNVPGGIDQYRASSTGYLSYSEPHIAVNPLDPAHMVAGSKMYQDLPRYLFKIGTFVSFDGGQTWKDNGHLPGYPKQTGTEATEDYHTTSDVWTAFDDEGNAYTMVLDHPPGSPTGAGWGMTLHKSTDGGRTWSDRIPMHENQDPISNLLFLDDKNTLVVDNSGPDRDGKTGNIYGCWSFDAPVANLAVFVSRSTDAGMTWSDPVNASGADRTVIGCHVVVGPPEQPGGAGALYVFWNEFNGQLNRMAKSVDGGSTFSPPATVVPFRASPSPFPNSAFRNLNIPAGAVDPRTGTVYLSYADYHATMRDAPCPPDEGVPAGQVCDSDVMLVKSTDGGSTWSAPIRVNQDPVGNGKDQFQQQIAITDSGQLNMMWFDRRHDPQNFYIDTFFARSNDGGATWKETRVTKSMWDPSINPPISPSGEFIGDYQGLAATDCTAVPFWQDTTLAALPASDPRHSPYQEAFAAIIPNTTAFGGTGVPPGCERALPKPATPPTGTPSTGTPPGAKGCVATSAFHSASVRRRGRGLRFSFDRRVSESVTVDLFQSSSGRRVIGTRRRGRWAGRTRSFTWAGSRRLSDGLYFARYTVRLADGRRDVRRFALERRGGRFRARPSFYRRESCGLLSSFKLTRPAFGGTTSRPLGISFRVARSARVSLEVLRGRRVIRRFSTTTRRAGTTHRLTVGGRRRARGDYRVRIRVREGGRTLTATLTARRI